MNYSQHIQNLRQYERDRWAQMTPDEQAAAWVWRQSFLWSNYKPQLAVMIERCHACADVKPHTGRWPSYFRCLCGAVFVLDKRSHICADEIERLSMRVME
jgi:hypothetical protein